MESTQESNRASLSAQAELHTPSVAFNPRNPTKNVGSGNKTIKILVVIPLNKERSASNSDNPMDNQAIGYGMSKGGDIAGAKPGGYAWRNSDDIAVFYNRRHTETLRSKPERCAFSKDITQESHHIRSGKIKLTMLHAKVHVRFPGRISAGTFV